MKLVGGSMANLTSRQLQAEVLCRDIQRLGAWCLSAMPMNENQRLRFQVLDGDHEELLDEMLTNAGWNPIFCNHGLRFTPQGAKPSIIYEIDIEHERPVVVDDRKIPREISEKAIDAELEAFRKLRL